MSIVTDDGGFKVKVLEAMEMGKAIVPTSLGSKGLNITDEKTLLLRIALKNLLER